MSHAEGNVDPSELDKFARLASRWWDRESEFKPLHDINPLRLDYIEQCSGSLSGRRVLDVGCGGGLLAEGMAARGAQVTGIDMAEASLKVARLHLYESGLEVDYRAITAEAMADEQAGGFDLVTCLEMLEHVPDPGSVIAACARLVRPGGQVVFSTLNRNAKSFALAIVAAEYVLGMLPRGTHQYEKLIRPSELDGWARGANLALQDLSGMRYNPLTRHYRLGSNVDVNYLACYQRPEDR